MNTDKPSNPFDTLDKEAIEAWESQRGFVKGKSEPESTKYSEQNKQKKSDVSPATIPPVKAILDIQSSTKPISNKPIIMGRPRKHPYMQLLLFKSLHNSIKCGNGSRMHFKQNKYGSLHAICPFCGNYMHMRSNHFSKALGKVFAWECGVCHKRVYNSSNQPSLNNPINAQNKDEATQAFISEHYGEILIDFAALMQLKLAEFEDAITVPSERYTAGFGYKADDYDSVYDAWITERIESWDSFAETLRGWAKLAEGQHMSGFTHGCVSTLLNLANLFDAINALEPKEAK